MYQGKRTKRGGGLRKFLLLGALLALALAVSVSVTMAFLIDKDNSVTNSFTPVSVSCEINEKVENKIKSSVTVKNTGDISAYIRVAVVVNKADEDGNIVAGAVTEDAGRFTPGTDWVEHTDGYYYYTSPVAAGSSTGNLISGDGISLEGIRVTILEEAIQADGGLSDGTKAVVNAWGVDPDELNASNAGGIGG